jgi:DNA-binding response OmpR family regulator
MDQNTTNAARSRILQFEDEPTVAAFPRRTLERDGHEIVLTRLAAAGVELLVLDGFQGVISGFRTPGGLNGADAQEWLRRRRPEPGRMVFITGSTASTETTALLAHSGTPCVEKPFRVRQLMAAVEKMVGKP